MKRLERSQIDEVGKMFVLCRHVLVAAMSGGKS